MLELTGVESGYGETRVLHGLDLAVQAGTVHALLGRNGVGKSTTLKTAAGHLPVLGGKVSFDGADISGLAPHKVARRGLAYVPETRDVFGALSVRENLELAGRLSPPGAADGGGRGSRAPAALLVVGIPPGRRASRCDDDRSRADESKPAHDRKP